MKTKEILIQAILKRSKSELRKATGRYDGKPILAYIEDGKLKTYGLAGETLDIATPKEKDVDIWADFLLRFNLIYFNGKEEMQDFINEGKPLPRHEYSGIPSWLWLLYNDGKT